jgi:hypothetical protein
MASGNDDFAVLLDKESDVYKEVVYQLKMGLNGHPASDIHVWQVDNPQSNIAFDRRSQGMLTLDCWTDCGSLDANNQMDDVCRRGFLLPASGEGMSFMHGNIKLDDSVESFMDADTPESTSGKQQHFYIFSKVAIGRPYIIDSNTPRTKPEGYDSLYMSKKSLDRDDDGVISADEYEQAVGDGVEKYEHEYIVTDPSQALPQYVVRFAADLEPPEEEDLQDPLKIYDRHDFFDPQLYRPVSLRDKMIGSHSMGEAATHKLVSLQDAYDKCIKESKKVDPLITQKKHRIMEELNKIDNKMRDINLNFADVEEKLYNTLKENLATLKEEVNCKTKILLSTELEYRRQLEEIDNSEAWLDRQRDDMGQTGFLQAFKLHTGVRSKMCQQISAETSILDDLHANLAIEGGIRIISENGDPLLSETQRNGGGVFDPKNNNQGTTELRQQLFADASAGATTTTGNTKRNLVSSASADMLTKAHQVNNIKNLSLKPPSSTPLSSVGGMTYAPPNFLATSDGKMMDNEAWTQSLQTSMGVGANGNMSNTSPAALSSPGIYTQNPPVSPSHQNLVPPSPVNVKASYQPARAMASVAAHYTQFSLSQLAERKQRQLTRVPSDQAIFRGSAIVGPADAKKLYYSIPFINTLPSTNLVYSTRMHDRNIKALEKTMLNVMSPSMVIVRSGEYVFGGYATDQWKFDGSRGGNPKGFIFSITLDCKIPYHGRQKDSQSGIKGGSTGRKHVAMWSGPDFMSFGIKDLCLRGDFRMCSSELEHSYSIGMGMGSTEAKSFLAGSSIFVADEIEVWSVQC